MAPRTYEPVTSSTGFLDFHFSVTTWQPSGQLCMRVFFFRLGESEGSYCTLATFSSDASSSGSDSCSTTSSPLSSPPGTPVQEKNRKGPSARQPLQLPHHRILHDSSSRSRHFSFNNGNSHPVPPIRTKPMFREVQYNYLLLYLNVMLHTRILTFPGFLQCLLLICKILITKQSLVYGRILVNRLNFHNGRKKQHYMSSVCKKGMHSYPSFTKRTSEMQRYMHYCERKRCSSGFYSKPLAVIVFQSYHTITLMHITL